MSDVPAKITQIISTIVYDTVKFETGNNVAGTRVRKAYQEIKRLCSTGRQEIQDRRNSEKSAEEAA